MTAHLSRRLCIALALLVGAARPAGASDLEFLMSLFQLNQSVDGLAGAEEIAVSSDGQFAYVASEDHVGPLGESGGIGIFDVDEAAGTIAFNSVLVADGARAIALSPGPTNQNVYVAAATTNRVLWFTRDPVTGLLSNPGSIASSAPVGLTQAWSVAVSNDGLHVYVAGLGDNSLAVFDRAGDGSLSHAKTYFDTPGTAGMDNPFEVRVTPDDGQVIVASQGDDVNLGVAFDRIVGDPLVTPPVAIPALLPSRGVSKTVAISPDNLSVYFGSQTATSQSPSVSVLDRDPMTNGLTANTIVDDPNLLTVAALEISPNGSTLIAVADLGDRLQTYDRAPDGSLSFFEAVLDGGAVPLDGATSVAITQSGDYTLSVAKGGSDDAIALFAPEPAAGALALAALGALAVVFGARGDGRNA